MKKRAASTSGVQMFSFLDAMICTLGALLVLLHAFARHGQIEAVRKAESKAATESGRDVSADLELLKWRVDQLKAVREKTEAQLAEERLRLAHLEDHERRLEQKYQQLQIAAAELARLKQQTSDDQQREAAALEAARKKLAEARDNLENARKKSGKSASYSVVPYEGPNGTHRRPIYIECGKDAMVLQPEGVELTPADFAGYLGSGNPLASALRGAREYYARQTPEGKPPSEPYPLLLVRPEGVKTYYAARSALESWGSDFGYELIGADWQMKYTEPDPRLAQLMRQIVADARVRMRELAVAMSQINSHRPGVRMRASSHGGFVVDGGPRGGGSGGPGTGSGSGWDTLDSEWASGQSGGGSDEDHRGQPGGGQDAGGFAGSSKTGAGGPGNPTRGGYGNDGEGTLPGGSQAAGSGQWNSANENGSLAGNSPYGRAGSDGQGRSDSPYNSPDATAAGGVAGSQANASAGGQPGGSASGTSSTSAGGDPSSTGGTASAGSDSQQSVSMGSQHASSNPSSKRPTSLAKVRGRDWGLPDGGMGMSPATRPIVVECHPDRLVIVSDNRNVPPKVTRLGPEAQENIDEFVSHVWEHMKGWGIAGRGLYWRPTLVVSIAPGAADRYAEVKSLLADSGLEVRERQSRSAASPGNTTRK